MRIPPSISRLISSLRPSTTATTSAGKQTVRPQTHAAGQLDALRSVGTQVDCWRPPPRVSSRTAPNVLALSQRNATPIGSRSGPSIPANVSAVPPPVNQSTQPRRLTRLTDRAKTVWHQSPAQLKAWHARTLEKKQARSAEGDRRDAACQPLPEGRYHALTTDEKPKWSGGPVPISRPATRAAAVRSTTPQRQPLTQPPARPPRNTLLERQLQEQRSPLDALIARCQEQMDQAERDAALASLDAAV
jgi:hypothetical protein